MFCVNTKNLSQNAPKQFIPKPRLPGGACQEKPVKIDLKKEEPQEEEHTPDDTIQQVSQEVAVIALARTFSGTLKVGQESTGYLPNQLNISQNSEEFVASNRYINKIPIKELYLLLGRELLITCRLNSSRKFFHKYQKIYPKMLPSNLLPNHILRSVDGASD